MKRIIGVAVVLAALAAVYFLFVHSGGENSADPEKAAEVVADKEAPAKGKRDRGDRGDRGEMGVLLDDDPEGNLRLEGLVLNSTDDPVGGATVVLNSVPPRTAVTGEDGTFFFDKLVARRYRVLARAADGVAGPVIARLNETNDPVILHLRPASKVEVTVVDALKKKGISSASVELRGIDTMSGSTDGSGLAEIGGVVPGRYEVVAVADGYAKAFSRIRVPGGAATAEVRLELRSGARVSGVVVEPGGEPVAGANVIYAGASEWANAADQRLDAVVTGADGTFRFDALPAGTFRFIARHEAHAPGSSEMVTLDGSTEATSVKIRLEAGVTVSGVVLSKTGKPVGSARVRIGVRERGMIWRRSRQVYADEEGRFSLKGLPRKELQLVAIHESASSEIVHEDVSEGPDEREVTLTLDVDGAIAGIVVDSGGEPIEGAQVSARPNWNRRGAAGRVNWRALRFRGFPRERTDAGGRFRLSGLEEGSYRVSASRPGVNDRTRARLQEGTEAEVGQTDLRIVLEKDGGIKGKVAFKNGDAPEAFTISFGWRGGQPFASKDGSFELTDLPARDYELTVRGAGFDSKVLSDITVEPGEITDLGNITIIKGRTIAGRVVDSGGRPVADALVRAGKNVIGDGTSSAQTGRGGPMGARTKETHSDEDGQFIIYGVSGGVLTIVAEHEAMGRSQAQTLRGTNQPFSGVTLSLEPFGALEGSVAKNGAPMEQVIVTAASLTAPTAVFRVASGADGKFRFDRLAPDTYKVSAMTGRSPMRGMGFHPKTATVKSGATARVDLSVDTGDIALTVTVVDSGGKELNFSRIDAVMGELSAKSAREIDDKLGAITDAFSVRSMSIRGNPATLDELRPGSYTVCATPYPPEVTGMSGTLDYMERQGDYLVPFCQAVPVTETPAEQAVTIEVTAPDFVPPPQES